MRKPATNVVLTERQRLALAKWAAANEESQSHAIRAALNAWQPLRPLLDTLPVSQSSDASA
jgi:hypothetical protein